MRHQMDAGAAKPGFGWEINVRRPCKPGSVPPRGGDGHSSGTRRLRAASSNQPGQVALVAAPARRPPCPYSVLLRAGLALTRPVTGTGGGLLLHLFTLTPKLQPWGGISLWRFPLDRSSRELPGALPPWSPDFPRTRRPAAARPSDRAYVGADPAPVKPIGKEGKSPPPSPCSITMY